MFLIFTFFFLCSFRWSRWSSVWISLRDIISSRNAMDWTNFKMVISASAKSWAERGEQKRLDETTLDVIGIGCSLESTSLQPECFAILFKASLSPGLYYFLCAEEYSHCSFQPMPIGNGVNQLAGRVIQLTDRRCITFDALLNFWIIIGNLTQVDWLLWPFMSGPSNHRRCLRNITPFVPLEASSAGFSFVSTHLHWSGSEQSRINCTGFAENTWNLWCSLTM